MPWRRVLLTALAGLATLALTVPVALLVVLVLAGPHAGLLPHWLEPVVLALGWLAVLTLPVMAAQTVWRRTGMAHSRNAGRPAP